MNKMTISTYLSIIILNVYRLNATVKRHRMAEWIQNKNKKIKIHIYPALLETHFRLTQQRLKVMKWKKKDILCK